MTSGLTFWRRKGSRPAELQGTETSLSVATSKLIQPGKHRLVVLT